MKSKFAKRIFSSIFIALLLFSQIPASIFAEDSPVKYTPFDFQTSGTNATSVEKAKVSLEIPNVVQDLGDSETDVISQAGVTRAIQVAAGQEDTVLPTSTQNSTEEETDGSWVPFSIKTGGTGASTKKQAKINLEIPDIVQETGNFTDKVMSQAAVTKIIKDILGGSSEPVEEWQPNPMWCDIEDVIKNDTSGYTKKYILLLPNSKSTTSFTVANAAGFKTSDGAMYSGNKINHTWNTVQDEPCNEDYTRWVIVYYDNALADTTNITLQIPAETLYMVVDTIKFSGDFQRKALLQSFKLINGSNVHSSMKNMDNMFYGCFSLNAIPKLDTSNATSMEWMFCHCPSLNSIPLLDTSNVTSMEGMFCDCGLNSVPLLNISNVTSIYAMFSSCGSLTSIPLLDASNVTNTYGLSGMFFYCTSLVSVNLQNAKVSLDVSYSPLSKTSLLFIINGLVDLTGQIAQTLTLGSTNLAKLTPQEIAIATAKNWTIA